MKRLGISLFLMLAAVVAFAQDATVWKSLEKPLNFYLANDLGRNGYYDQKPIAELMGKMAETIDIEFVVHPDLMLPWFPVLGNHEYRGNTQAVIDYSNISARWEMPARYYTKVMEEDGATIRLVLIDTAPLLDKYREDTEKYPDAGKQDMDKQLAWLDSVLASAKEDWVMVVGHHPIYADTDKNESERSDMQKRVDSILRKHGNVDMYVCGHIHNFQHIRKPDSKIDYVVNTSGSLAREVKPIDGTQFCSGATGFSLITLDKKELCLYMMDKEGKVLHTVRRTK